MKDGGTGIFWTGDDTQISSATFPKISMSAIAAANSNYYCLGLKYIALSEMFEAKPVDCESSNLTSLCMVAPDQPLNCTGYTGQAAADADVDGGDDPAVNAALDNMLNPEVKKSQAKSLAQMKKSYR